MLKSARSVGRVALRAFDFLYYWLCLRLLSWRPICEHEYAKPSCEDYGEKFRYRCTVQCRKCGRVDTYTSQ